MRHERRWILGLFLALGVLVSSRAWAEDAPAPELPEFIDGWGWVGMGGGSGWGFGVSCR